jgi:UDPglucose 6-dehydrogenase
MKIGFIGQGYVGKNYADNFERRGFAVVRYALEEPYCGNKEEIKKCDIVFIAVPTPTTPRGFDDSILRSVMPLVGEGKIAVIKSTVKPGSTESIQEENPNMFVLHSPEFLTEATAAYDAAHPHRNIIGMPKDTDEYRERAKQVLDVLPKAPYERVCAAREAELVKYGGNCWFYTKVIFINLLYDLAQKLECDWGVIQSSLAADPRIGETHLNPIHQGGRGAGGHCFIKDFEAFSEIYESAVKDSLGVLVLEALKNKNIELLTKSGKDLELLEEVYGKGIKGRDIPSRQPGKEQF